MKGLSLFANVGIGETYLDQLGIEIVVANELLEDRAEFYKKMHPNTKMICGDITDPKVYSEIFKEANGIEFIMATPPCQGMSQSNAIKDPKDPRNSLIKMVVKAINDLRPKYVLIENVPGMARSFIEHNGKSVNIMEFVTNNIPPNYTINHEVLNASDYGTPQHRKRLITLISSEGKWEIPEKHKKIHTVREAIGHLPSLESGDKSGIPWHFGRKHNARHILWMKHTPTGETAYDNPVHYPQIVDKNTGKKRMIRGFRSTYKRIKWEEPSPTIGMTNGSINSQNNVHPGNKLKNGTYSDARVLSVKELTILCGLPEYHFDKYENEIGENFMRHIIGECFPPKLCLEICKKIPSLSLTNKQ
jgi:DNA (cytosine-5)-methyltransferase 1